MALFGSDWTSVNLGYSFRAGERVRLTLEYDVPLWSVGWGATGPDRAAFVSALSGAGFRSVTLTQNVLRQVTDWNLASFELEAILETAWTASDVRLIVIEAVQAAQLDRLEANRATDIQVWDVRAWKPDLAASGKTPETPPSGGLLDGLLPTAGFSGTAALVGGAVLVIGLILLAKELKS